jgi:hypothetical protein
MSESFKIVGGATLPSRALPMTFSPPFAQLHVDEDRVSIPIHPRWLATFFVKTRYIDEIDGVAGWSVAWSELEEVVATRRAVFFVPRETRGARFVVFSKRQLRPLHEAIAARGIPVRRAFTTYQKVFWI